MEAFLNFLLAVFIVGFILIILFVACLLLIAVTGIRILLDWVRTGRFSWGCLFKRS